jgi:DNA-binding transcriptional ArsR family regulator
MNEEEQTQTLLKFFKTMANAERLQIVGLLAIEDADAAQIARRLSLPPYAVLRHLERLEEMNLIQAQGDDFIAARQAVKSYRLNTQELNELSRRVLAGQEQKPKPQDFEGEAYERKVLSDFMSADGRLKALPVQEKKLLVVLRHLVQAFEPGERYTEKQVNEILRRYHIDTAALRRYMVDNKLLERKEGLYWRP